MRNLLLIIAFVACSVYASAQKAHFIYLQSDNSSPFYLKMNDKIYSSATSGYLILSDLVDSTYNFSIGFPSSQSESRFIVPLAGKDRGFLLKNFDSGLGLFDLQNLTITYPEKDDAPKNIAYIKRNDDFSSLLSKAARDTTLLYAVVRLKEEDAPVKKEEPKSYTDQTTTVKDSFETANSQADLALGSKRTGPDSLSVEPLNPGIKKEQTANLTTGDSEDFKKDTVAFKEKTGNPDQLVDTTANNNEVARGKKSDTADFSPVEQTGVFKKSQVKKHSESSTSEGFGLVFYDSYDGGEDTIRLLIPNPPIRFKETADTDTSSQQEGFIHVDELKRDTVQQAPLTVEKSTNVPVKAKCKSEASDKDFFKLRKDMAAENTDEAMVTEAKKFFRNKCFSTEQIKNLSALFLTSAGKYLFFDAAYLHVSDQQNFPSLESEIKDDYYLKRFKALIGE